MEVGWSMGMWFGTGEGRRSGGAAEEGGIVSSTRVVTSFAEEDPPPPPMTTKKIPHPTNTTHSLTIAPRNG